MFSMLIILLLITKLQVAYLMIICEHLHHFVLNNNQMFAQVNTDTLTMKIVVVVVVVVVAYRHTATKLSL
jgi:hypothetical protein